MLVYEAFVCRASRATMRLLPKVESFLAENEMGILNRRGCYEVIADDEQHLRDFYASFLLELKGMELDTTKAKLSNFESAAKVINSNIKVVSAYAGSFNDTAKGMHYTQYRGLAQVTSWVKPKFVAMNLRKFTNESGGLLCPSPYP